MLCNINIIELNILSYIFNESYLENLIKKKKINNNKYKIQTL